jgi:hypothetical protein
MAWLMKVLVPAYMLLCVQSHQTFLKQCHGSRRVFTFTVPILYTHKVLQQLCKVNVFAMGIAVFLSLTNLLAPATDNKPTLAMSHVLALNAVSFKCS